MLPQRRGGLSRSVFTGAIITINPLYIEENSSGLKCLTINVSVKDDIALTDNTITLNTNKMGVPLPFFVNLKTEQFDLVIQPMAKDSLNIGDELL